MFHQKILNQLKKFSSGALDNQAVEQWVLSNYQQILDSGEETAIRLANDINSLFVEQGEDLLSVDELESALIDLLKREESSVSIQLGQSAVRPSACPSVRKRLRTATQVTDIHLTLQGA